MSVQGIQLSAFTEPVRSAFLAGLAESLGVARTALSLGAVGAAPPPAAAGRRSLLQRMPAWMESQQPPIAVLPSRRRSRAALQAPAAVPASGSVAVPFSVRLGSGASAGSAASAVAFEIATTATSPSGPLASSLASAGVQARLSASAPTVAIALRVALVGGSAAVSAAAAVVSGGALTQALAGAGVSATVTVVARSPPPRPPPRRPSPPHPPPPHPPPPPPVVRPPPAPSPRPSPPPEAPPLLVRLRPTRPGCCLSAFCGWNAPWRVSARSETASCAHPLFPQEPPPAPSPPPLPPARPPPQPPLPPLAPLARPPCDFRPCWPGVQCVSATILEAARVRFSPNHLPPREPSQRTAAVSPGEPRCVSLLPIVQVALLLPHRASNSRVACAPLASPATVCPAMTSTSAARAPFATAGRHA